MNKYIVTIVATMQMVNDDEPYEVHSDVEVYSMLGGALEAIRLIRQYEDDNDIIDIVSVTIKEVN